MTHSEFDATVGKWYTQVGIGSVVVWAVAFLLRIIPVEWITHHPNRHITMPVSINWTYRISVQHLY
jgi:hypothetical protein